MVGLKLQKSPCLGAEPAVKGMLSGSTFPHVEKGDRPIWELARPEVVTGVRKKSRCRVREVREDLGSHHKGRLWF